MTTIRFVGDVPVWLGVILSLIVCVLSWRYYRRESFDLPRNLKWILPLLRASAFFLGIMMLTGPVLHHRKTIGEPGHVKIYIDRSESMSMRDRHMPVLRKLRIANGLGWLNADEFDVKEFSLAEQIGTLTSRFENRDIENPKESLAEFLNELELIKKQYSGIVEEEQWELLLSEIHKFDNSGIEEESQPENVSLVLERLETFEREVKEQGESRIGEKLNAVDDSYRSAVSMFDETNRLKRVESSFTGKQTGVLEHLKSEHDVEVFLLEGSDALPARSDSLAAAFESKTRLNSATDLASGIMATQRTTGSVEGTETSESDSQTAVVLFTDGQHNSGPSPLQTAKVLGGQGVTVFCVAFGAVRQAEDLAVVGVEHPDLVFKTDRVRGSLLVRDTLEGNTPFTIQVQSGETVLWQKELASQGVEERRVEFDFEIEELVDQEDDSLSSNVTQHAVPLDLQAVIVPVASEFETQNNQRSFRLSAITQSYKVLILDGRSRWETRYLRNVFERDKQWDVTTVIAGPGTDDQSVPRGDQSNQFPTTRDDLFEYDCIILGEISAELFQPYEFDWLKEFVEDRGGGLVLIDGQRGKLQSLASSGLQNLLPIEWTSGGATITPHSLQLTDRGANEPALKLVSDELENRSFWTQLPAPHLLVSSEALPGGEVLVNAKVGEDSFPAIVTRSYGAGRILYLAFDETWRWRYKTADLWHQRIWNQLATYVMPRPYAVSDDYVSIDTGSASYDYGENVDVRVQLRGVDGKPLTDATADALFWKNGQIESTVILEADETVPGMYRGRSGAMSAGDYTVSVRASGLSDSALQARGKFVVEQADTGELAKTNTNEELLRQVAEASGGKLLREEEVQKLPELLQPFSHGRIVESEILIWQSYWWFGAMILLLTMEWVLRKRSGLL